MVQHLEYGGILFDKFLHFVNVCLVEGTCSPFSPLRMRERVVQLMAISFHV